ncbi:MAG TPA: dephospho-CoA kinase [Gemmatimonadaceae bacterium]
MFAPQALKGDVQPGHSMRLIALTGNIASGKSTVAAMLEKRGATIIDADALARDAVRAGSPALGKITDRWGKGVIGKDGSLDRDALRAIVFDDQTELDALNDIVHPEVMRLRNAEVEAARERGDNVVVCVIPLLFERHLADDFNTIVLVDAPRSLRLERIVRDRGLDEAEAMKMIAAQMPADLKRARANYVIENDGSLEALEAQVDALWQKLSRDSASSLTTA